jgi:hypothetical protein
MVAVRTSETSVHFNKTTRRYMPEGCHRHTLRRENLNLANSVFGPQSVFVFLLWLSEQTAITSLNGISQLVSVMETRCVFFETGTVLPNII